MKRSFKVAFVNSDPIKPLTGWFLTDGGHTQEYYIDGKLVSVQWSAKAMTEEDMDRIEELKKPILKAWLENFKKL